MLLGYLITEGIYLRGLAHLYATRFILIIDSDYLPTKKTLLLYSLHLCGSMETRMMLYHFFLLLACSEISSNFTGFCCFHGRIKMQ